MALHTLVSYYTAASTPCRALQGISMHNIRHVLESTTDTVHFCFHAPIHKITCFWILFVTTSLDHNVYSWGHWYLTFLLVHIFLLINMLNKKGVSPIHAKFLRCLYEIDLIFFPSRITIFRFCVLITTFSQNLNHVFETMVIFWAEPQKRWGKGASIQSV